MVTQAGIFRDLENTRIEVVSHWSKKGVAISIKSAIFTNSEDEVNKSKRLRQTVIQGKLLGFMIHANGGLGLQNQLFVPNKEELTRKERF